MKIKNIIVCSLLLSGITYAEETMWNKVKSNSSSAWDSTKTKINSITSEDVKDGAVTGYEKTKEVTTKAWDTTKKYSSKAWDTSKEKYTEITKEK